MTEKTKTKKKSKTGKRMGRPLIEIDQEQFEKLCSILCTQVELEGWFKCSADTINRWCKSTYSCTFAEISKKFSEGGKSSLRRAMWKKALGGHPSMMIWLSKQHLGMTDKNEQTNFNLDFGLNYSDPAKSD